MLDASDVDAEDVASNALSVSDPEAVSMSSVSTDCKLPSSAACEAMFEDVNCAGG
jgi:hypothetical protein